METQNPSPGWKTSELYLAAGVQISAFVVALGTSDTTAKIVTGITALAAIIGYFLTRHMLKAAAQAPATGKPSSTPTLLPFILLALLLTPVMALAGPADAPSAGQGRSGSAVDAASQSAASRRRRSSARVTNETDWVDGSKTIAASPRSSCARTCAVLAASPVSWAP